MRSRTVHNLAILGTLLAAPVSLPAQVWEVDDRLLQPGLTPQTSAEFGSAVAIGDFDGDDTGDLVVGSPGWDQVGAADAGRWSIFLGEPGRTWSRVSDIQCGGATSEKCGAALAAGDFDGDGRDEMAIGRPGATVVASAGAGAVSVWEFTPGPDVFHPVVTLEQNAAPGSAAEPGDGFGAVLAVGNFDGDAYDDLAVSSLFEDNGSTADAGVVQVFYGSAAGLTNASAVTRWATSVTAGESFGAALAAGDFDGDGYDDLAVGIPDRELGELPSAGAVEILFGSATGLLDSGHQLLTDAVLGGGLGSLERFGFALAAANFDETPIECLVLYGCFDDLAIGVPGQQIGAAAAAGKVVVAYGGAGGFLVNGATTLSPASVGGAAETNDRFGRALAAGRLDRPKSVVTSFADLAIGTPAEDFYDLDDGFVHLVFGATAGIDSGQQEQSLDQKPGFELDPATLGDGWGAVLAIGDLDQDGWGDLVVGVPNKDVSGHGSAGVVEVLYGGLFNDGFESQSLSNW